MSFNSSDNGDLTEKSYQNLREDIIKNIIAKQSATPNSLIQRFMYNKAGTQILVSCQVSFSLTYMITYLRVHMHSVCGKKKHRAE